MKLFRRLLMFLTPLILIGLAFVFIPEIRPDVSEYRDLRRMDFQQGIEISKKAGIKRVDGYFHEIYAKGFRTFDFGKIRLAVRNDSTSAYSAYGHYGTSTMVFPLLIDPVRDVKAPKKPVARSVTHSISLPGGGSSTAITDEPLPGGTRFVMDGDEFDFTGGEIVLDGRTFSAIDKPILVVLREDLTLEMTEELDEKLMPADTVVP